MSDSESAVHQIGKRKTWTTDAITDKPSHLQQLGPRAVNPANQLPEVIEQKVLDQRMRPGSHVVAEGDGRRYRISANLGTLERVTPKPRGKAGRRQAKLERRLAREAAARQKPAS